MGEPTPKPRRRRRARCCMWIGALALLVAVGGYLGLRHLLKNWGGPGDGHYVWEPPAGSYRGQKGGSVGERVPAGVFDPLSFPTTGLYVTNQCPQPATLNVSVVDADGEVVESTVAVASDQAVHISETLLQGAISLTFRAKGSTEWIAGADPPSWDYRGTYDLSMDYRGQRLVWLAVVALPPPEVWVIELMPVRLGTFSRRRSWRHLGPQMRGLTVVNASASRQSADEVEVSIEGVGGPWVTTDFPYGGQWRIYAPPKKEGLGRVEVKATYADGTTEHRKLSESFFNATLDLKGTRGGAATSQ